VDNLLPIMTCNVTKPEASEMLRC